MSMNGGGVAMALVTYVLLISIQSGLSSRFSPEVLGTSLSKALAVLIFEFFVMKIGCYILNIPGQSQFLDLVAYGGYKFVR
jgi:protein transport protein YIF1